MKNILCILLFIFLGSFQFYGYSVKYSLNTTDNTTDSIIKETHTGSKTMEKVRTLQELKVTAPKKYKTVKFGKKHRGGMLKSFIYDGKGDSITGDHPMKGQCTGFRIKSSEEKPMWLKCVGLYVENQNPMTPDKINFKINFYDASLVSDKTEKTSDFLPADIPSIYFQFINELTEDGKFTFVLPEPVLLPKDAMVEIEFLDNLDDKYIMYKSNLFGNSIWDREISKDPEKWIKIPIATNFFLECIK